jgi:murein peptide amidase A
MDAKHLLIVLPLIAASCAVRRPGTPLMSPDPKPTEIERATPIPITASEPVITLGRSVEGQPIEMHLFGDGPDATLILAAIHGNEGTSATVARRLIEHLRTHPEAVNGRTVAVVPVANPDGLGRRLRTNKNLVDLNRNFPAANWARTRKGQYFGGERAASEPETVAVLAAIERVQPVRIISIHSMDKPCNNYDGPARDLAELMKRRNGYVVKDNIGYPTPGSLGSWAGIDRGIPIITLELPRSTQGEPAWEQNREALLSAIRAGAGSDPSADIR